MDISDLFYYCETSKTGLRRMRDWCSGRQGTTVRALRGDETGSLSTSTPVYYDVYDGKRLRRAHEVIWELVHGPVPEGMVVDHKDGDGLNNKLENLRLITEQHNSHNQRMKCNNKSGVSGVHLKMDGGGGRWIAQWNTLDSKRQQKSFSVKKHGYDEAFRLACEHRAKMIEELNTQGAGYTERHGT